MIDANTLIETARACGIDGAVCMPNARVVYNPAFRAACAQNACGYYNRSWMCPPDVGEIDILIAKARTLPYALVYQTIAEIEDSFDIEGMTAAAKRHAAISRRLRSALAPYIPGETLYLTSGACGLCPTCTKPEGLPCRFPNEAMASLESYGVDVYQTVKDTCLRYTNGQNTVTYFGMTLFSEACDVHS